MEHEASQADERQLAYDDLYLVCVGKGRRATNPYMRAHSTKFNNACIRPHPLTTGRSNSHSRVITCNSKETDQKVGLNL